MPAAGLTIAASKGRFDAEGWRVRKDGSKFWASVLITALTNERGQLRGFAKLTRDMTEQKLIRERLQESERLAAMGTTAAVFAHEIGNPLNAISTSLQLLQLECGKKTDDAPANEILDMVLQEIKSLGSLLGDYGVKPPPIADMIINLGEAAEFMFDHNLFQDNLVGVDSARRWCAKPIQAFGLRPRRRRHPTLTPMALEPSRT